MALFKNFFNKKKQNVEAEIPLFLTRDFSTCCQILWEGYSFEEMKQIIGEKNTKEFEDFLEYGNFTCNEALAIYQYSINSNMMLGLSRGFTTKEEIKRNILDNLVKRIKETIPEHLQEEIVQDTLLYMEQLDTSKNFKFLKDNLELSARRIGIPPIYLQTSALELLRLNKAEASLDELYSSLHNKKLKDDIVLYRAVNSNYLEEVIKSVGGLENLHGKILANSSVTSTTYDKEAGFIKRHDMDIVFEMNAPQGTSGINIENLSGYKCEKEVLLAGHNLEITNIRKELVENYNKEVVEKWYISCDVKPLDLEKAFAIDGKLNENFNEIARELE